MVSWSRSHWTVVVVTGDPDDEEAEVRAAFDVTASRVAQAGQVSQAAKAAIVGVHKIVVDDPVQNRE
jgi:hypothetical protein